MTTTNVALITGSTSGIGLECAKILAQKKYNLLLISNEPNKLDELQIEFSSIYGIKVFALYQDLSTLDAAQSVYQYVLQNKLEVEILINNAGFFFFGEVVQASPEKASKMILLHIHTTSLLCLYIGRHMKERGRGYIMNVSSISAFKDFPGIAFYASSKKFIKGFTRSLRTEMKYYGVKVTALCPGATATNLYDPNVIDVKKGMRYGIMMTAAEVADAGIRGLFSNRAVIIPGLLTKIMTFLSIITPYWIIYLARKRWKSLFDQT
ncbi:MAG: SDR family NAD(P)-dependent oxidoreductase [Flavobacteriales bacterium]|nr:SDR family NAD(P)-dependent oxidoreductase [Flavobacteriales bacterium]